MMNSVLFFVASFVLKMTVSQTFSHTPLLGEGNSLTVQCSTTDFNGTVYFRLGTDDKGGCFVGDDGLCNSGIDGYNTPTRQDTTITKMTIASCNETTDTGNWTCTYDALTSPPVQISSCSSASGGGGGGDGDGSTGGGGGNKDWPTIVIALICYVIGDGIVTILIYRFLVKGGIFLHKSVDDYDWLKIIKVLLIEAILPVISTVLVDVLMYCFYGEYQKKTVIPITVVLAVVITIGYTFILTLRKCPGPNRLQTFYVNEEAIVGGKIILLQDQLKSMKPVKHIEWQHEGVSISGNSNTKFQGGTVMVPTLLITGITENDGGNYTCNIVLANDRAITFNVDLKIKNNTTGIPRPQPDGEEGTLLPAKEANARHLKTGGALLDRPENLSQQTDKFDSTNLPIPNRLPPVEMVNNPSSADALEGENTDRTQKERKKKKKRKKDEGTSNPVDVQDNAPI